MLRNNEFVGYAADWLVLFCRDFAKASGEKISDMQLLMAVMESARRLGIDLDDRSIIYDRLAFEQLLEDRQRRLEK